MDKLIYLIKYLLAENPQYSDVQIPQNEDERFRLFRSLVNIRASKPISEEFISVQDEYLKEKILSMGITDITSLAPIENGIFLWKGDITTLKCGAIVNAANSQMIGCFQPCHDCMS